MIRLIEIKQTTDCKTPELRKRVQTISKGVKTVCYRAVQDGNEVAFVALDRWPEQNFVVLYELYVPKDIRQQGNGRAVLDKVEHLAGREGFSAIRLTPEPLDPDIDKQDLIDWYQKRDYQIDPSLPSEMVKLLG